MSGIVISYRREDSEGSAGRLYDRLVARYGADFVFMDFYSIESGANWSQTIDDTVARSDVLLAIIGPRWSSITDGAGRRRLDDDHDYVRHEVRTALTRNIRVLPVLVQGAPVAELQALPADVAELGGVQAFSLGTREYDRDIDRLCGLIDGVVGFGGEIPRFDQQRTAVAGFVGLAAAGPTDEAVTVTSWRQFESTFGGCRPDAFLAHGVSGWFANGGEACVVVRVGADERLVAPHDFIGTDGGGLTALDGRQEVTIVAAPDVVGLCARGVYGPEEVRSLQDALVAHCEWRGNRVAVLDPLPDLTPLQVREWVGSYGADSQKAALYYPWVKVLDSTSGRPIQIPPSGHIAGTWARNDQERGVWAAPANLPLRGVVHVQHHVTANEANALLRTSINPIRGIADHGIVAWGARTLSSQPRFDDIATVRLMSSLGTLMRDVTTWAAFEPNTHRTWNRVESGVRAVLDTMWRQGAFPGKTADDAFFAKCDDEVNAPELVASGRVRVEFGFAVRTPGDFIRMSVEQPSGDVAVYAS